MRGCGVGRRPPSSAATWGGNLVQAMPAADGAIAKALALEASAHRGLVGRNMAAGRRALPGRLLHRRPGARQLITHIRFPARSLVGHGLAPRRPPALAHPADRQLLGQKLTLAVDGSIDAAAVALGPVAAVPFRAAGVEAFLPAVPSLALRPGRSRSAGPGRGAPAQQPPGASANTAGYHPGARGRCAGDSVWPPALKSTC